MGPIIRIFLRYGIGAFAGYEVGANLAADPDVVIAVSLAASFVAGSFTELWYYFAKKYGWVT